MVSGCNRVAWMDESVKEAWAEVDNQLKRRSDLIPHLVSVAKGYREHEKEVFESIANARAKFAGAPAGANPQRIQAAQGFDTATIRLLGVFENYPNLKMNEQFSSLSHELNETEIRISIARTNYNARSKEFNTYIREVFGFMFAIWRGVSEPKPYYEMAETEKVKERL